VKSLLTSRLELSFSQLNSKNDRTNNERILKNQTFDESKNIHFWHFETELVDELLGGDERRVGGGVECVTAVIELLAPDQLLGARRGVGVDRIERASVIARGRVLLRANRIARNSDIKAAGQE
jgi:hypothetical protein